MTIWPKNESPTGRGYGAGSDSYRPDDVAQMEREEACITAKKKLIPPGGIDFDAPSADDPNFGDYNIPPGGNHP